MEVLAKGSGPGWAEQPKRWSLEFCLSPLSFQPDVRHVSSVGRSTFRRNVLTDVHDPQASVETQKESVEFESPLVFRSIGYKSEPLAEFASLGIVFDDRKGVIDNHRGSGRVTSVLPLNEKGHFPGLYCAGWVKRGPTGVIASTMEDAFDTAEGIARDWQAGKEFLGASSAVHGRHEQSAGWEGVKSEGGSELAKCAVNWDGWLAIDEAEQQKGKEEGKKREKFTAVGDMLEVAMSKKS